MATPAAGLPADAPESKFTLAELRAQHQAVLKAKQLIADRQVQIDRAKALGAKLAKSINEAQTLQNKLNYLNDSKAALEALRLIIQAEGRPAAAAAADLQARAQALVRLQAQRDLALAALRREQAAEAGLGQDYAAGFRQQIRDGKLRPVRKGVAKFCDPQPGDAPGANCGFDPREPSEIYLARYVYPGWEADMEPYETDPSGLFISMLQWRAAEDQSTRNLDAPWPGEGPDAVPEPTDPRIKFARATDNYGMFSSSQNYDPAQLTQHENIFLQAARGAYLRRQSAKERAADLQIGLYVAAGLTGGVAGFAAIGVTAAVIAAASAAALSAAVASSSGLPPEKLTDPLAVLAALDRVIFRPVYQPVGQLAGSAIKVAMDAMAVLDRYVPGWAVVVDVVMPLGPLLPTLVNAIGNAAGVGFDSMNAVLQVGGKVAEAAKLGPIYDPAASVVSDAVRASVAGSVTTMGRAVAVLPQHLLDYNATIAKAINTVESTKGDLLQGIEAASIEVAQGIGLVVEIALAVPSAGASLSLSAAIALGSAVASKALQIAATATGEPALGLAALGVGVVGSLGASLASVATSAAEVAAEKAADAAVKAATDAVANGTATAAQAAMVQSIQFWNVATLALKTLQAAMSAGVLVGQADQTARLIRSAARASRNVMIAQANALDAATEKFKAEIAKIQAARAALRAREGLLGQARGFVLPLADQLGVSEDVVLAGSVVGVGILAFLLGLVGD